MTTGTRQRAANKAAGTRTRIKTVRWRRLLLIAVLCAAVWPMLAWVGAELLIVKSDSAFAEAADAIVVFSGSSTYIERADWAARLYREGRAPVVVLTDDRLLSGWNAAEDRNPYFYELAAKELQERGVPAERVAVVSEPAMGTYDESLNLCRYATSHQLKKLLIVTSAYHSRRALWSMRHACAGTGIEMGVNPAPPGWQTPAPSLWWLRRWGWRVVAGEYVKMIYYRLRY